MGLGQFVPSEFFACFLHEQVGSQERVWPHKPRQPPRTHTHAHTQLEYEPQVGPDAHRVALHFIMNKSYSTPWVNRTSRADLDLQLNTRSQVLFTSDSLRPRSTTGLGNATQH